MVSREIISFLTPSEIQRTLAERARSLRLQIGLTQQTLALRAGVTHATLRRFERTGEISLKYLTRIFLALGRLNEFNELLKPAIAASMAELESRVAAPQRKRGSR